MTTMELLNVLTEKKYNPDNFKKELYLINCTTCSLKFWVNYREYIEAIYTECPHCGNKFKRR
jgi:DNA-directed RNA polymerase subunit RPC12/RpoP